MLKINRIFLWMLLLIPASLLSAFLLKNPILTFILSTLALIPLARLIGYATMELVLYTNPAIGGIINATFGNVIEVIFAILALKQGLIELVKASLIGSIIGNILLLIGLSILAGGIKFKEQHFNKESVGVSSTMLIIAVTGLAIPTVFALTFPMRDTQAMSTIVAAVLAAIYLASLVFAFYTHKHLFDSSDEIKSTREKPSMSFWSAVQVLLLATGIVALESDLIVQNIQPAMASFNLSPIFIGAVIIAIITNIAEKANAIHFALHNRLDVSLEIGLSSANQIALFVVPILVLVSRLMGFTFSLVFTLFQIIAMLFAVMIVNYLSSDGKCNWLEGAQLISVYIILAVAFFFH